MTACNGLTLFGIMALLSFSLPLPCQAAVTGDCSICHSMHNSENGEAVAYTLDNSGQQIKNNQAFANLLKTDCLGCHTNSGATTISTAGGAQIPIVFNLTEPTYPPDGSTTSTLAGGNFHWTLNGEEFGHNVHGIANADSRYVGVAAPGGSIPVGPEGLCTDCHGTLASDQSGCKGCHLPLHHLAGTGVVVESQKGWYRFLGSVMEDLQRPEDAPPFISTAEGVIGIEASDWEQDPLADRHNAYQGTPGTYTSYLETGSINQKCAGCHGRFHNETLANSTWIRHPGDAAIPDTGEFSSFTTYNPLIPVARQNITAADSGFDSINRGSDMVSCISCHRAHGSPNPAMLRWDYRGWPENGLQNGCAICHTSKD
jgi:predicted CXXCH cytochrome family protein